MQTARVFSVGLVVVTVVFSTLATAQSTNDLAQCRAIEDAQQRLKCYDDLVDPAQTPSATTGDYQKIDLVDMKLDATKLRGKNIEVRGLVIYNDTVQKISNEKKTAEFKIVDENKLSRDQKRHLIEKCSSSGCPATVRGMFRFLNVHIISIDDITFH